MAPVTDPVAAVQPSGLTAELVLLATLPPSSTSKPSARVNGLVHAADGSGRVFANDTNGLIWLIKNGQVDPEPFLDVRSLDIGFIGNGQGFADFAKGLRSFAFHPDFENPGQPGFGKLYTVSTHSVANPQGTPVLSGPYTAVGHDVISEWQISAADATRIDPSSRREVLRIAQPGPGHTTGDIVFNPHTQPGDGDFGKLYVAVGNGQPFDWNTGAFAAEQNPGVPIGKILRIDPLRQANANSYGVPADNPFVGRPGHLPEVWALGFRHPQDISFDIGGTGELFIADIGEKNIEEVNLGRAGANYGWDVREGWFATDPSDINVVLALPPDDSGFTYPVAQYDHGDGNAIAGGFVYRGDDIPTLIGHYVFGDIVNGRIFHVAADQLRIGQAVPMRELALLVNGQPTSLLGLVGGNRVDTRFGQDEDGDLYVLSKQDGRVWKLAAPNATPTSPLAVVRVEAEDMHLVNYTIESQSAASGGRGIKTVGTGQASFTFAGAVAKYDVTVGYHDEHDGRGTGRLLVDGVEVGGWAFDRDTSTWLNRTFPGIDLAPGDTITIETTRHTGEYGRVDFAEISTRDGSSSGTGSSVGGTTGGSTPGGGTETSATTTRFEAENMLLVNFTIENQGAASGGKGIKTAGTGQASLTFAGTAGLHDVTVGYHDEHDGQGRGRLLVDNVQVASWAFGRDTATWLTRTFSGIQLDPGDTITIETTRHAGEYGRVDYLDIWA